MESSILVTEQILVKWWLGSYHFNFISYYTETKRILQSFLQLCFYLKKSSEPNEQDETPKPIQQTTTPKTINKLTNEERDEYNNKRKDYHKQYYEKRKDDLLDRARVNDKVKYYLRITRELNQNKKDFNSIPYMCVECLREWFYANCLKTGNTD